MPACIGRDRLTYSISPVLREFCNTSTIAETHDIFRIAIVTVRRQALRRLHFRLDQSELGALRICRVYAEQFLPGEEEAICPCCERVEVDDKNLVLVSSDVNVKDICRQLNQYDAQG